MLLEGKRITTRQIIDRLKRHYGFKANRKTIYDDIAAINRIMPVKVIPGRNGGYIKWDVLQEIEEDHDG
jgi:predicted DNA-binding transcriptional regulator YafY